MKAFYTADLIEILSQKNLVLKRLPEGKPELAEIWSDYQKRVWTIPLPTDEFYVMYRNWVVFIGSLAGLKTFAQNFRMPQYDNI